MAARHSVATPFRFVAHAAKDGAMGAATRRSFATSALRAKEIAGDTSKANKSNLPEGDVSELPNLRHAQRGPQGKLHAPIVNPTGMRATNSTRETPASPMPRLTR